MLKENQTRPGKIFIKTVLTLLTISLLIGCQDDVNQQSQNSVDEENSET